MQALLKAFVGGLGGVMLGLLVWHLWTDHKAIHEIVTFINAVSPKLQALP